MSCSGFDLCHYCCECCHDNEADEWPGYNVKEEQWPDEAHLRRYVEGYLDQIDAVSWSVSINM